MQSFEKIKDPIIRIYGMEVSKRLTEVSSHSSSVLYGAKRSVQANPRIDEPFKRQASEAYSATERVLYSSYRLVHTKSPEDIDIKTTIDNILALQKDNLDATGFFITSRRFFQRYTNIDTSLNSLLKDLNSLETEVILLRKACLDGDEKAKKQIYDNILGEKLEQLDAPYLFDIVNFIVELLAPPLAEPSANATEALALLTKEAADLAAHIVQTNVDRRFLSALQDYISALTEHSFSPIKVDLYSNKLRAYLIEMKEQLPGFAIAEVSALLLSQEQVLRQFPAWRSFESDASKFSPTKEMFGQNQRLLEGLAAVTRNSEGVASDGVLDAFDKLEDSIDALNVRNTTELGVFRSIENFIKTNIRHVINTAKAWQVNSSPNQARYARYLERLIPLIKLYIAANEKYAWLLPVIQWLEDLIKTKK